MLTLKGGRKAKEHTVSEQRHQGEGSAVDTAQPLLTGVETVRDLEIYWSSSASQGKKI